MNSTTCHTDELQSTGHSDEDENCMEKKRRRRKIKESDLQTNEDLLTRRLENLVISDP
jgi:hypothetical protein